LGIFGGDECTYKDYYNNYITKCPDGHINGSRDAFAYSVHNVQH